MRPAPERVLVSGLLVRPAFEHGGSARTVVHRLKYEGIVTAAEWLAEVMASQVPSAACLVPVPRNPLRRIRYGVDPAVLLAKAVGIRAGMSVVSALDPPLLSRRHAGRGRRDRPPPRFVLRRRVDSAVLIDDVLTTGSTLTSAEHALGPSRVVAAVVATAAPAAPAGRWLPPSGGSTRAR